MGSTSDWEVMAAAAETLEAFGIPYEKRVVSAHRTPDLLVEYAKTARGRGIEVIIANGRRDGILTDLVLTGEEVPCTRFEPAPRAASGVKINGAKNAALIAVSILALSDGEVAARLDAFRTRQTADVLKAEL